MSWASKKINDSTSSNANWHLAQKSETLVFDQTPEETNVETFVWRKKNQKIGLDKIDPEQIVVLNKIKQEETQVSFLLD